MAKSIAVPATSFIVAVLLWITFFVLHLFGKWTLGGATLVCLVVGALILFSNERCIRMNGPRAGHVVRTGTLVVFTALTFWKVGTVPGAVLLVETIAAVILSVKANPSTAG